MRIIPAIDIIGGACVRLEQGDFSKHQTYNADPLDQAKQFEDHGMKFLHLVDLDGARSGKVINYKIIESIASKTNLHIDFGGGVRSLEDVRVVLESGAKQVSLGSVAVKKPELVDDLIQKYGTAPFILSADVKDGIIQINGWQDNAGVLLTDFVKKYGEKGILDVICTDISKDGMLSGPGMGIYKSLLQDFPATKLVASGGVSSYQDLDDLIELGCDGAIIGKAIYEGRIDLKTLEQYVD